MTTLPSSSPCRQEILCLLCSNSFMPRDGREPCPHCGGKKRPGAITCKPCEPSKAGIPRAPRRETLPAIDCIVCGASFKPGSIAERRCPACILKSKSCEVCGVTKKDSPGPRCRKCTDIHRIDDGKTGKWNRREEKSIEQVISEVEAFGLLSEKQYAFGYVMGVVFGDGSISKVTNRIPYTRSDGTTRYHDSTIRLIRLSVTSQAFAERFAKHLEVLIDSPVRIWTSTRTNFDKSTLKGRREEYSVQLFTIDKCHVLLGRYLAYLKHDSELYELLRFPVEVTRGFVHGMIDSEGYVNDNYTDIANKRVALLDVMVFMFEQLGYSATVYTSPSQSVSHLRTSIPYIKYGL